MNNMREAAGPVRTEVIVIGGGVIGTSVAYYLSKAGKAVVLLEREDLASGSAGATDGYITYHTKKAGIHLEMAIKSGEMYEGLSAEFGCDLGYVKNCGGLQPIDDEEQWDIVARAAEEQKNSGVPVGMLDIADARKLEPELSPALIGALYSPAASKVNPLKVTFGFAKAAEKLGAKIITGNPVKRILLEQGRVVGVETEIGGFRAEYVVNAAGSWAGGVAGMAGLNVPIRPRRGQIVVSEPIGPFIHTVMQCGRYTALKHRPDMLNHIDKVSRRIGLGFGAEQTEDGSLLISNTREWADFDRSNTMEGIEAILKRAANFLPGIVKIHFIRCFSGLRPFTPDGLPILGPVDGAEGFIMAAGHEGDGIALAPLTGKVIAEYIVQKYTSFPIEPFNLRRFTITGV